MNNRLVRIGLPLAIVVALVFGVTYMSQITPAPPAPKPIPGSNKSEHRTLIVPNEKASWDGDEPPEMPAYARYAKEMEQRVEGHYDFWVANVHDASASVALKSKSCKCADVQLGVVPADAVAAFLAEQSPSITGKVERAAVEKLLTTAAKNQALTKNVEWKPLQEFDSAMQVPAADAKTGLRLAIVRLVFHPKDPGHLMIVAEVNHVVSGGSVVQSRFEVPVAMVPPVMMYPETANIGEINSGDQRKMEFVLWSATRDSFPLKLPDLPEDPTFVFGEPVKLDGSAVIAELIRMKANRPGSKPRSGYKVSLTIHESLNDKLLELGPLSRRLMFNPSTEYETVCETKGTVRGDVQLIDANGANADRIRLGEFEADRPTSKTYILKASSPGMQFRVVSWTPAAIIPKLEVKSAAAQLWQLKVDVPPNSIAGPLPYGSSIVLETVGKKARRVRVPVEGNAMIR